MHRTKSLVVLAFLTSLFALAQKPSSVKMWALLPTGEVEVEREIAVIDSQNQSTTSYANPGNTFEFARLPQGKAKLRYKRGESVQFLASLPETTTPRSIELLRMENHGAMRTVNLRPFGASPDVPSWNTLSFRARRLQDGRWLFEPAKPPDPGEYCFSPKYNNDNFCFGVEKK